jgi:uncharacterized membrane protein (DUF4010 family)
MTFIALPILPDDPIGPFGGVRPREIWLIAIMLAGVSFLGYAAVKFFGVRHGLLLASAAGGLASSTAVVIANARRAATGEGAPRLLAAGVAVASAIMFLRVAAIVTAVNPRLLVLAGPALLAAAAVTIGFGVVWMFRQKSDAENQRAAEFRNPFDFWSVIGFALFLAALIVLGRAVGETLGPGGAVAGALFVGLADVDAITVSMARLAPSTLSAPQAALAILAAAAGGTVSKAAVAAGIGRGSFAVEVAAMAAASLLAGGVAWWTTLAIVAP